MAGNSTSAIPVLTDAVAARDDDGTGGATPARLIADLIGERTADDDGAAEREALIAELQTQIAAGAFDLTDEIIRAAFAEMEASIYERIASRLRRELPEMIDRLLRERLGAEPDFGDADFGDADFGDDLDSGDNPDFGHGPDSGDGPNSGRDPDC